MARTKQAARKSTGNGGYKRKRAQAQGILKKLKTREPAADVEDTSDNLASDQFPKPNQSDLEEDSVEEMERPSKSRRIQPKNQVAKDKNPQTGHVDYDKSIAARDPALLSDLMAQNIRKHFKEATSLEQSDNSIPSSAFKDTSRFENAHTGANLPAFLEEYVPGGKEALSTCSTSGSPHTAVVVASGMRVADLYRSLLAFNTKDSKVGKIIAKHMRLPDTVKYLKETKVGIAVTTPRRLLDLIKEKAVNLDSLQRIVIDGSYQNEKEQTIFDMKELFEQLIELMNMKELKPKLGSGKGQIELIVF